MMLVFRLSTAHMLRITIDQAHIMFVEMKILLVDSAVVMQSRGESVRESKHQCSEHFLLKFSIEKHHS